MPLAHVIHILRALRVTIKVGNIGLLLVHPFANTLCHIKKNVLCFVLILTAVLNAMEFYLNPSAGLQKNSKTLDLFHSFTPTHCNRTKTREISLRNSGTKKQKNFQQFLMMRT